MILQVVEIFSSLQGEGPFMGRPAVFVRLAGCVEPLCPWCDTPEALGSGEALHLDAIIERVVEQGPRIVVITGGEPFLQWGAGLDEFEKHLFQLGLEVHYETSGKVRLPHDVGGYIVCSPKYINKRWCIDQESVNRATVFKFVVADDPAHVTEFVDKHAISKDRVWIMPQAATRSELLPRMGALWEFCNEHDYNFSPRLHILTFDDKKGI